jgi:Glycosyltransferase family 9 (heptosyltransferase)
MNMLISRSFLLRGIDWLRRNEFAAAVADFDAAIRYAPDDPYAHWNKATALLSLGDYASGFVEYEWGWKLFNWRGFGPVRDDIDRLQALPMWDGSGGRLLLYHELGFGDAVMCFRFLPELKRRAVVTLVVDRSLARLARQFEIDVVTAVPADLTAFDARLPLFGAMRVLRQTVETIPRDPYINARLAPEPSTVGIAWSGRTQTMFSSAFFASMLNGYSLHSLQPDSAPPHVCPLVAGDFADTVKVIERMEHVVTVDTAVAHLAGAMGHPSVHLVLPFTGDWRWWRASAWYPKIKTYRQPTAGNDWREPFVKLNVALNATNTGDDDGRPKESEPPDDAGPASARSGADRGRDGALW